MINSSDALNYEDLIFLFFKKKRPELLFEISNNAASRLECCPAVEAEQNCIP